MSLEAQYQESEYGQALPPGTRIEEFIIERVLGSGGFGITYLARDARLGRQVVIKENLPVQFCFRDNHSLTVAPRHSQGEDAENFKWSLENFSKEAAMLASLDHPVIVKVHRSFEAFGTAYFVMPFVEGMALDELAKGRQGQPFSEDELRSLLERVLDALSYLHDRGIYHRDIKPGNILITNEGAPVLIDFGSARQRLSERSMTVVESPGYTPFEQLQTRGNVGPWSDLYALAGTLVKLMTGETLPKANDRVFDDPWQALTSRTEDFPAFSIPLLESIDHALELHPRERWQDAGEWLLALTAQQAPPQIAPAAAAPSQVRMVVDGLTKPPQRGAADVPSFQIGEERDFDLVEGCKIRMCWIPPGEFLMGSPESERGRRKDERQHRVILPNGFWMGKFPITQLQWSNVMGNRPSEFGRPGIFGQVFGYAQRSRLWENLPVENVSWLDVCGDGIRNGGFLEKVNTGASLEWQFNLPSEAEWEYACRAGTTSAFNDGSDLTFFRIWNFNLSELAWWDGNSGDKADTVGQKDPNRWGLHDMHGNVWEWCADCEAKQADMLPTGASEHGIGFRRSNRGGGSGSPPEHCRSAFRSWDNPEHRSRRLGFRLIVRCKP